MKRIKTTQSKKNRLPSFGPHPCQVYLRLPYMDENLIRLAKQASLASLFNFKCVSLHAVYNTNLPFNRVEKDVTSTHELSNVIYVNMYINLIAEMTT